MSEIEKTEIEKAEIEKALRNTQSALLARRGMRGAFEGQLSTSALSTATASIAFALAGQVEIAQRARLWLCQNQNDDGGWGDTIDSPTNISTTVLAWACLGLESSCGGAASAEVKTALVAAERWLKRDCGDLQPKTIAATLRARYGADQTFSVPILTTCALTGRLGSGRDAWRLVPALPFELAACPHQILGTLSLRVVSYALPALIAIGQVRHYHRPTRNPVTAVLRMLLRAKTLRTLTRIQPEGGGFLEAAPLTSFVVMSLVSMGLVDHPVVVKGLAFLTATVRSDGSWPIDTNLDTWVTSLSVSALGDDREVQGDVDGLSDVDRRTCDWLLKQQLRTEHPYTHAAPGGWAWTDLSGGVPDADDTPAALLALRQFYDRAKEVDREVISVAAEKGVQWLLDLQNRDGGIPTFCRGWGRLPFDQSSPDLTAHAIRAFVAWRDKLSPILQSRIDSVIQTAVGYLIRTQRANGAWVPLWFGNQDDANQENPLYGTSRVLRAVTALSGIDVGKQRVAWLEAGQAARSWLIAAQRADGSFSSCPDGRASIEETALALEALAELDEFTPAVENGALWLSQRTSKGTVFEPSPIGLYFASLWYSELLYPVIWTASALRLALACHNKHAAGEGQAGEGQAGEGQAGEGQAGEGQAAGEQAGGEKGGETCTRTA